VCTQFDIFERRPSVAALSDDSSDAASPSGSRAASRASSRAASAGPRATAAFAAQAAAALGSIAEPAGSTAAAALPDPTLVLPDPQTSARSESDSAVSGGSRADIRQSSAQLQTTTPVAQPAGQQTAAVVQVVPRPSPVDSPPLRHAIGGGLTVGTDDKLAKAGLIPSPAAAASSSSKSAPAGLDVGQDSAPAPQSSQA